ncbi:hypothetical protein NMYAN_90096 [Nitrosomonas nitrosa]|uniref:Uncharacterized protein n=1 Tax=Nitrosomonas nitrosa TaxID=52442 RepID=A0A8H8Z253_9PROT|nr:hypothetical protein NMYAN_90096 [Nitrosomonas nitrosa]
MPQEAYPDEEVDERANLVYQHVYSNYPGRERSIYTQ